MSTTVNDANFVAVAGELLPGQRVIKIDGRYIPVGIGGNFIPGGGVDFEGVTVTASDILAGVVAVNSSGTKVTGTISTVTPSVTANVFNVRKGYVSRDTELTVPMSNVTETDTAVTITPGYVSRTLVYDLGSDIDFSGVNVTADKMLANSVAINAAGDKVTGTIATVRATSDGETVVVPVGYIASEQTFQVSGSGYDTSEVTVTADKMLIGYTAVGPDGELIDGEIDNTRLERPGDPNIICINPGYVPEYQEIEIPTVSAEFETQGEDVVSFVVGEGYVYDTTIEIPVVSSIDVDGNRVSVSAGYIKDTLSETIPEADINESSSSVTIGVGYVSEPLTYQLGSGAGEGDTVEYGYITSDGKVQKLDLSSGTPAAIGSPVSMSINLIKTGQPEPDYGTGGGTGGGSDGGSVELYKCVSVDEGAQTWTGRKAVMADGQYVLQTAETSGLSSVGGMKIEKGKVYSADGKFRVNSAYNHCLCICPFTYTDSPLYGECKVTTANQCYIDYETSDVPGIGGYGNALKFNVPGAPDLHEAYFNLDNLPSLDAFSFEFWCYSKKERYSIAGALFMQNKATGNFLTAPNQFTIASQSGWHHVALSRTSGSTVVKAFIDGQYICDCSFADVIGGSTGVKMTFSNQWWINNFIFYDYAKYTNNFTPSQELNVPEWEDRQTLTVSGAGIEEVNGIYELITPNAAGRDRIWAKDGITIAYDEEWYGWMFKRGYDRYYSGNEDGEPWESEWGDATDDESGGDSPTVTLN